MIAPDTSTTLLRDLAGRADHPRWGEFVVRYRPLMESYLHEWFPSLEMDDLIQETFVAIAKTLPDYRYVPDEKGHFHNYLTGILHHKALNALKRQNRRNEVTREYALDPSARGIGNDADVEKWRETVCEVALHQLLADPSVTGRKRQIFMRTAMKGESPEDVAASLAVSRAVVDQTKKRMMDRLRELVERLKHAGNI